MIPPCHVRDCLNNCISRLFWSNNFTKQLQRFVVMAYTHSISDFLELVHLLFKVENNVLGIWSVDILQSKDREAYLANLNYLRHIKFQKIYAVLVTRWRRMPRDHVTLEQIQDERQRNFSNMSLKIFFRVGMLNFQTWAYHM